MCLSVIAIAGTQTSEAATVQLKSSLPLTTASGSSSWPMPKSWRARHYPSWYRDAICIHEHEGAWNANTGNGYYGGMQFLLSTWQRAGGSGYPHQFSPREQLYRAWVIYKSHDPDSWGEWGTSGACGV